MKRALLFIGFAVAGFASWQWWLSRRTNVATNTYFETVNRSMDANAKASRGQLQAIAAIAPVFAAVKDIRGLIFNGNRDAPVLTADGRILDGYEKTSDDVVNPDEVKWFGFEPWN